MFVKKIKKQIFYILSQITNELDPFLKYDSNTTNMQILKTQYRKHSICSNISMSQGTLQYGI